MAEQTLSLVSPGEDNPQYVARFANFRNQDLLIFMESPIAKCSLAFSQEEVAQIKQWINERYPDL